MSIDQNRAVMRRPRGRLFLPTLALGALVVLLSGCISLGSLRLTQTDGIGAVVVSVSGCAHKDGSSCPRISPEEIETTTGPGQMLVALSVPTDFPVPATFTFDGRTSPVFRPSPTYTSELQRLRPARTGERWAGYISDVHNFTPGARENLTFTFDRPSPPDGSPRAGQVTISVFTGARTVSGVNGDIATRPVYCGATSADVLSGYADNTICGDDNSGISTPVRDLALTGGAPVTVTAGAGAIVPITARYVGSADPAINFSLAATTSVPQATAVPNAVTFAPQGDSTNTVLVSVAVPASTPPGTYAVTLTARLGSEVRTGTGAIVVTSPGTGGSPQAAGPSVTSGGSVASARCAGRKATIVGTSGPDRLKGTARADVIAGRGGADIITGLGGNDLICGDGGADRIAGGRGNDRILGGAGPDRISGGAGRDRILGGPGPDRISGGAGPDRILGGPGRDRLSGGAGRDVLVGGPGADRLLGGGALDRLLGGPGANVIRQ